MKLKEFINKTHDLDRIRKSALEVKKHIVGCVTEDQRDTARKYIDNWKRLMYVQEKLDHYKGFAKFVCKLTDRAEHEACKYYIDAVYDLLLLTINKEEEE